MKRYRIKSFLFPTEFTWTKELWSVFPEGATILDMGRDYMRQLMYVIVSHESFPESFEGDELPREMMGDRL